MTVGIAALAASLGCSHSSTTPPTNPTPTPAGGGSDVLYISSTSGSQCNDVKAYALPALTSLGSFDVSGSCAGAFAADNSGNLYAIEVACTSYFRSRSDRANSLPFSNSVSKSPRSARNFSMYASSAAEISV